jgi:Lon protease-like protein
MIESVREVPLFPLPKTVLFPGMILPLHIYEPRYKEMVGWTLEQEAKEIAIANLRPGWEQRYHENPPVYKVMTIGEIIDWNEHEDGRYDIVLRGKHRGRLLDEQSQGEHSYRFARLLILEDDRSDIDTEASQEAIMYLQNLLKGLLRQPGLSFDKAMKKIMEQSNNEGLVADILARFFCHSDYDQQGILEELKLGRRSQLVALQLKKELSSRRAPRKGT